MSSVAEPVPSPARPLAWFWQLIKEELTPYPGREALVARMMFATTLVMIITMAFRLRDGAYGAAYALTISRESPRSTAMRTLRSGHRSTLSP